jgi:hypothetical protein
LISFLGILATYNGYVIGQFKLANPAVHTMAAAGYLLFGRIGREVFNIAQVLVLVFIMAAHITAFTVMMNVRCSSPNFRKKNCELTVLQHLTHHWACSIIWSIIAFAVSFLCSLPRTMHIVSYISILSSVSVFAAVLIVMVSVARANPNGAVGVSAVAEHTSFTTAFTGVLQIVLAYCKFRTNPWWCVGC